MKPVSSLPLRSINALIGLLVFILIPLFHVTNLENRPLHADEAATGAYVLGTRLSSTYHFDATHGHGPTLTAITVPIAFLRGEHNWSSLSKLTLRLVPLLSTLSLLALIFCLPLGFKSTLWAALFVGSSPLLAYYSNMYIHEPLLLSCGMIALIGGLRFLETGSLKYALLIGLATGLMAATKETFVIPLFSWCISGAIYLFMAQKEKALMISPKRLLSLISIISLTSFSLICLFYSDFFRHLSGILDFFKTYFSYKVVLGHENPFLYYLELMLFPHQSGPYWWFETGIFVCAIAAYFGVQSSRHKAICRFLIHSSLIQCIVFSCISYKTPWLMSMSWLYLCLGTGIGAHELFSQTVNRSKQFILFIGILVIISWQGVQMYRSSVTFASDGRNPYAYVPTVKDCESLPAFMHSLEESAPPGSNFSYAVIGNQYWPLPWYLRKASSVAYWDVLPAKARNMPLLFIMPSEQEAAGKVLETSHNFVYKGLREDYPILIAIRNDWWSSYHN